MAKHEKNPERLQLSPAKHEVEIILQECDPEAGVMGIHLAFDYGKDKMNILVTPAQCIAISQKLNEFAGFAIRQGCDP